jgi:hypothetical protein
MPNDLAHDVLGIHSLGRELHGAVLQRAGWKLPGMGLVNRRQYPVGRVGGERRTDPFGSLAGQLGRDRMTRQ